MERNLSIFSVKKIPEGIAGPGKFFNLCSSVVVEASVYTRSSTFSSVMRRTTWMRPPAQPSKTLE